MKNETQTTSTACLYLVRRFSFLFSGSLLIVVLLTVAMALLFRLRSPHFASDFSPTHRTFATLVVSSNGEWGITRVCFHGKTRMTRRLFEGTIARSPSDLVCYRFGEQAATRLQLQEYRPQRVALSPGSDDLVVACKDGSIRVLGGAVDGAAGLLPTEGRLRLFARTSDTLLDLAFSPHGGLLVGLGARQIHVWRWPDGTLLRRHALEDPHTYAELSFAADASCLLTSPSSGTVQLWNAHTGYTEWSLSPADADVKSAAVSPDGTLAGVFLSPAQVRVYQTSSGEELWRDTRSKYWGTSLIFSRCGRFLAKTGRKPGADTIIVFAATDGHLTCTFSSREGPITGLAAGPGPLLYAIDSAGTVHCWDLEQKRERWQFATADRATNDALF